MYYKAMQGDKVVDLFEKLETVKYFPRSKAILSCSMEEIPQGVVSSDQSKTWHVIGWPELPGFEEILLCEIEKEEYESLKKLLDEGKQPTPPAEEIPDTDPSTLAWAKKQKIALSKLELQRWLAEHPLASYAHEGKLGYYAVTADKQSLMMLNFSTYQLKKQAGYPADLTWNETGQECTLWNETDYVRLSIEIENYVKPLVARQQIIEKDILNAESLQEVDSIEIAF